MLLFLHLDLHCTNLNLYQQSLETHRFSYWSIGVFIPAYHWRMMCGWVFRVGEGWIASSGRCFMKLSAL